MAEILLEHLGFRYPGASDNTLEALNLAIGDGEAHALLGASGAGKTTLLNLLSGLLYPTAGRLCFDGVDVSRLRGRERRVAQVFQFPVLYEALTVRENLGFALGKGQREGASRIVTVAAELGIEGVLARKPSSLSLFEKQLVAVGKALVRPDLALVLLDEPLTAVEPQVKWRLRQALKRLKDELGVTMIYVTHDQTEALTFADRVSVLTAGGILQTGTPEEIYRTPAHEFVGHFVGSPGMNFLPAAALGVAACERVGFRSEWARLTEGDGASRPQDPALVIAGAVRRQRALGTRDGVANGLVTVSTEAGEVVVSGACTHVGGARVAVCIDQHVRFAADGSAIGEGVSTRHA